MSGKFHFITRPAIGHQRRGQPTMFGQYVGGKIAPDMVAAEMIFLFNQYDFQFGPHPRNGERDQTTSETAADYRQIAFNIVLGGGRHDLGTSRTVP